MCVANPIELHRMHLGVALLAGFWIGTVLSQETPAQQGGKRNNTGNQAISYRGSKAAFAHTEALLQCIHADASKDDNPAKDFEWVEALSTEVQRRGASRTEALSAGSILYPQDTVVTGPKSIAQFRFSDGTLVVAGRDTRVRIAERQVVGLTVRTSLLLYQGIVRVRISRFAAYGNFAVQAPKAVFDFPEASGLVVRYSKVAGIEDQECTIGTLVSGHVKAHGVRAESAKEVLELLQPGETAHFCRLRHKKKEIPERYYEKSILALTDEVPFFVGSKAQRDDTFELPLPLAGLSPLLGDDEEFPELPGVQVSPPLILDMPPFNFTPSIPDLISVDEISP